MKNGIVIILWSALVSTGICNAQEKQLPQQKRAVNIHNGKCGIESNMISSLELPYNTGKDNMIMAIVLNSKFLHLEESYMRITKNESSKLFNIKVFKYSKDFPAHKPSADRTLYSVDGNLPLRDIYGVAPLLDKTIYPIECYHFEGVFYIEDCR